MNFTDAEKRINELRKLLEYHSRKYYVDVRLLKETFLWVKNF